MTDELKPCPFCGGTHIGWTWHETYSVDSSYATFGCDDCGAGFLADDNNTLHPDDVAAWNRRAPDLIPRADAETAVAEVEALIREAEARGYNNGMLTAISVVAEERNKRNPGPLFEVLNKALGKIDDARFEALRKDEETPK